MSSDLTFITNEKNKTLLDRFQTLIKDTRFFDVLAGYFYTSGFYSLYKPLQATKKIRILIGIKTNPQTLELISQAKNSGQQGLIYSHGETKNGFSNSVVHEMEGCEDNKHTEEGVLKFIEWLKAGKLEIRAYPSQNIHSKLYIMTFAEDDRDAGRVITGSSNFTESGLSDNLEFNVELKNRSDYDFALNKFNELWENSVDVKDKYIETIETKSWLNNNITPYQLYLKFLYEYFKDEIRQVEELSFDYIPDKFKKLEYQEQAVLNAKKILEEYGGVFISDVVGLGKTYMGAMLANQIDGRTLVIAPPVLLDKDNPGSWTNVFSDFRVQADYESIGKLDALIERGVGKYKNIFIDEAHRFRTETNTTYEKLAQICRGKRVVLVTATPYNNTPKDILSQIKLFQNSKKSTITGMPNLELFFNSLDKKLKGLDRQIDNTEYIKVSKENANEVREKVLKYLMVRRTRKEIETYFSNDIKKQGLRFPDVENPSPVYYQLNDKEDEIFNKTIRLISHEFKYSRYTPLLPEYYKGELTQPEELAQKNMGKFMKVLLVKRLESSFVAFKNSIGRFIYSYETFIKEFKKGNVYISKKYITKIFELLEDDNEVEIQKFLDEDKARKYPSAEFTNKFIADLENDLSILKQIQAIWADIARDPKLIQLVSIIESDNVLKNNKLIIFTESRETAEYLAEALNKKLNNNVLCFSGSSSEMDKLKVIENFDAKARHPKDDYRILLTTEVLSEGVNLHRANVVINYDIPWNPTRMMQRVGRINRVDTGFDKIFTYNFFPTKQSNDQIKLKEAAESKIHAFISLLGADARLLTNGEPIESHELFNKLLSKDVITGEEGTESELKYLKVIKDIRDNNPDLFNQIKLLPKKARTAKPVTNHKNTLLTYFKKDKLQKFYMSAAKTAQVELDFINTAKLLESDTSTPKSNLPKDFYELLDKNKEAFDSATAEEVIEIGNKAGRDACLHILKILKAVSKDIRQLTDEQEAYLRTVMKQLEEGAIPKQTAKVIYKELDKAKTANSIKILGILQKNIPVSLLESHYSEKNKASYGPREVILSEYFI